MPGSGLLSHAVHAATVSQAGILMSSLGFSHQNGRMLNSAGTGTVKLLDEESNRKDEVKR